MQIILENLEDLERKLNITVNQNLPSAMMQACAVVENAAKHNAPKGTGALRRNIMSDVTTTSTGVEGIVYSNLEYAPYVEYGTGLFAEAGNGRQDVPWKYMDDDGEWHTTYGQAPYPFMRPALNENRKRIKELLARGISKNGKL